LDLRRGHDEIDENDDGTGRADQKIEHLLRGFGGQDDAEKAGCRTCQHRAHGYAPGIEPDHRGRRVAALGEYEQDS